MIIRGSLEAISVNMVIGYLPMVGGSFSAFQRDFFAHRGWCRFFSRTLARSRDFIWYQLTVGSCVVTLGALHDWIWIENSCFKGFPVLWRDLARLWRDFTRIWGVLTRYLSSFGESYTPCHESSVRSQENCWLCREILLRIGITLVLLAR